jgi:metal-responsive CopG/Arc/MetJ family transcriptional regulator
MRVHITLEEDVVEEIDRAVGPRRRSSFIADAVRKELESKRRWETMRSAVGSISDEGHPWDDDVAKWVHDSRREDPRRVG